MAQPTNVQATNDMVGIREDLSDIIYEISPVDTPFISSISRIDVSNTKHEWQTDALGAATNNAVIEGDDATTDAAVATTRVVNHTQISDKVARTTGTANAVNTAGRAKEIDYQMLKRARELRRDMEKVVTDNKAFVVGDDTTARECAGAAAYITTNIDDDAGATASNGTGSNAHSDGTQRPFTEDQVKSVLKQVFDEGGNPNILMVGAFNRQIASSFSGGRTNMQKTEDPVLHATFDVYDSDFGELKIVPNRFMEARTAMLLETDMWALGFLPGRNMMTADLAKTGDSERRQILSEYTLEARNQKANGIINDLTVS